MELTISSDTPLSESGLHDGLFVFEIRPKKVFFSKGKLYT